MIPRDLEHNQTNVAFFLCPYVIRFRPASSYKRLDMKYALLFCAGLFCSVLIHAQSVDSNNGVTKLKVLLSRDSMSVVYKDQPMRISDIKALDSFMKKIPDLPHLHVEFDSYDSDREKSRSIAVVLDQCHCPTASRAFER